MTSLIIGIVLIVGGIAFAAAPFFRRPDDDSAAELPPAPSGVAPSTAARAPVTSPPAFADGALAADLEELELDRAMGKLAEDDYRALRATLDARARQMLPAGTPANASSVSPPHAVPLSPPAVEPPLMESSTDGPASPPHVASASADGAPAGDVDAEIARRVGAARSRLVTCARCGPRPEPDAHFCSHCGTIVGGCPACGHAPLPTGARFCDRCGSALLR